MDDFNWIVLKRTPEAKVKQEQERQREATAAKTERLRELRLAKEAAEREVAGPKPVRHKRHGRAELNTSLKLVGGLANTGPD